MIQLRMIQHLQNRMHSARLRVVRAVYQAAYPCMHQRARAHGARFNCSKQFTVVQTMVTDVGTCVSQRDDFCMGCGIVVGEIAIPSPADHSTFTDDDRPHRHFSNLQSALCATEGFFHEDFVSGIRWGRGVDACSWAARHVRRAIVRFANVRRFASLDNAQNGAHYIRDHGVDDVGHDRCYYTPGYDQPGQGKEGPNSGWQVGEIGFHNHVLGLIRRCPGKSSKSGKIVLRGVVS